MGSVLALDEQAPAPVQRELGGKDLAEHTVGGKLVGFVHDLFSDRPQTSEAAASRSRTHDVIAEVLGDTVSMLPGVRWIAGGGVRGVLMTDVEQDAGGITGSFVKNFAEGVALNKVAKFSLSRASSLATDAAVSRGLAGESKVMFGFGFGTGAVKSTFNENSWYLNGALDLDHALGEIVKGGAIGGALGVPAGMIGTRVGGCGARMAAGMNWSPRVASVSIGMGSGYSAGAVFGGLDSAMRGGSISEILLNSHNSGLMGLGAGGFTGAFLRMDRSMAASSEERLLSERIARPERANASAVQVKEAPGSPRAERLNDVIELARIADNTYDRLNISAHERPLAEGIARLGMFESGKMKVSELKPGGKVIEGDTYETFAARDMITREQPVRTYNVGGNKLVIVEQYARQLDEVLSLRKLAAGLGIPEEAGVHRQHVVAEATAMLKSHPLSDRAHPADMVWMLDEMPDRTLVKKLFISDKPNPSDPWHQHEYKPGFKAAATASTEGVITFYMPKLFDGRFALAQHEWAHLLKWRAEKEGYLYDDAIALDKRAHRDWDISEYAKRDSDESFAEHAQALLNADADTFFKTVAEAPVRSTVIGRALRKALSEVPEGARSPFHWFYEQRVSHIENTAMFNVQNMLEQIVSTSKSSSERSVAVKMLGDFGTDAQMSLLKNLAKTSHDDDVRMTALNGSFQRTLFGEPNVRTYANVRRPVRVAAEIDFLVEMASPDSLSRTQALEMLSTLKDQKAKDYLYVLTVNEQPGNRVAGLFDVMQRMPDMAGKSLAWNEALRLTRENQRRVELAISVMQKVPELRSQAADVISGIALPHTKPLLQSIADGDYGSSSEAARAGLRRIEVAERIRGAEETLRTTSSVAERHNAIELLGATGDYTAISPLLQHALTGSSGERAAAQLSLSGFDSRVVRYYAQQLAQKNPSLRPVLSQWYR